MAIEHFTDEQISAWVDGQLDPVIAADLQAWLQHHPEAAARARAWAEDRDALQAQWAGVLSEPVPAALRAVAQRRAAWPMWARAAAAGGLWVVGAGMGGAGVWHWQHAELAHLQAQGPAQGQGQAGLQWGGTALAGAAAAADTAQGWVQRAALAHLVYVPEPRHAVEVKAQEEHLARWLTRRIDATVHLYDLRDLGFELVGGRLLPDGPGKSAQLMYQDAEGRRVTLYLRKPEQAVETAFRYERQGEVGLFYWIEPGCAYALVGTLPRQTLLALAESVFRQHPPPQAPGSGQGPSGVAPASPQAPPIPAVPAAPKG